MGSKAKATTKVASLWCRKMYNTQHKIPKKCAVITLKAKYFLLVLDQNSCAFYLFTCFLLKMTSPFFIDLFIHSIIYFDCYILYPVNSYIPATQDQNS